MNKSLEGYLRELSEWDASAFDEHWATVDRFINEIGPQAAADAAIAWCHSTDSATQSTGLDLLGVLARVDASLLTPLFEQAKRAVRSRDEGVRWSAAVALQNLEDDRAQPFLLALAVDADSDVRFQAVSGLPLPHQVSLQEEHPVVQALLRAMVDDSGKVRDWATFGLSRLDVNSPATRDALAARLQDPDEDTSGEAAVGLAMRKDPRVYPELVKHLASRDVGNLYVQAAAELADPRLLPFLLALEAGGWKHRNPLPFLLEEAIRACANADASRS